MARLNLVSLIDRYNNDDKCRDLLERIRWPAGVCCMRCGDTTVWEIEDRHQWECSSCEYHFSVTAGTIMHRSHLPLRKWFLAIYLMCESKKGMSAKQLERTLGVSYKTAWYLCHRIREAMGNDPLTGPTLGWRRRSGRDDGRRQSPWRELARQQDVGRRCHPARRARPAGAYPERQEAHPSRLHRPAP